MTRQSNPFEFDAAPNLDPEHLETWYVENRQASKALESNRNIIMTGERGSGKSMTLMYHSLDFLVRREKTEGALESGSPFGIFVPCKSALMLKEDYKLLEEIEQKRISASILIFSVISALAKQMQPFSRLMTPSAKSELVDDICFELDVRVDDFHSTECPFVFLGRAIKKSIRESQEALRYSQKFNDEVYGSFGLLVLPLIEAIRSIEPFKKLHFSFLIDDAHDMNDTQKKVLNSWLAYRDRAAFSFKVALANKRSYNFETIHGGALLEGHDYLFYDLQEPMFSKDTTYAKFVKKIIEKRLQQFKINKKVEDFFPPSPYFLKRLETSKREAERQAIERGYKKGTKQFTDYVYKQKRAVLFRGESPKENKPTYSGFKTLTQASTGVVRNLLHPCFKMYDRAREAGDNEAPMIIPADIQNLVIQEVSKSLWDLAERGLESHLEDCSGDEMKQIYQMLNQICAYFRRRLEHHESEPRVIVFVISEKSHPQIKVVDRLLEIAERAQLLYTRYYSEKKGGGQDRAYVLNRLLLPRFGLDVEGQNGTASIKAGELWLAATEDRPIKYSDTGVQTQGKLL